MQKICFKYKGTMVKRTNKLKEEFEYDEPKNTVREALYSLNEYYNYKLDKYVLSDVSVVVKINDGKSILIATDEGLDTKLGKNNTITFFYLFKGG